MSHNLRLENVQEAEIPDACFCRHYRNWTRWKSFKSLFDKSGVWEIRFGKRSPSSLHVNEKPTEPYQICYLNYQVALSGTLQSKREKEFCKSKKNNQILIGVHLTTSSRLNLQFELENIVQQTLMHGRFSEI